MSFLTIFTAPKPFTDPHVNVIQRNAIQSWTRLGDDVQVLMIGDEEGMAEVAAEYGAVHLPDVSCSKDGIPIIGDMFRLAREASDSPVLAIVNADIMLLPDFVDSARMMLERTDQFVLLGRRWNLEVNELLDFSAGWVERLQVNVQARGKLHEMSGSDYFLFSRKVFNEVPDFTIGRAGWDNWMIYKAVTSSWQTVDATEAITVVHQNHDYAHLPEGKPHYKVEETFVNVDLAGGYRKMYNLLEVKHKLVGDRIRPVRPDLVRAIRRLEMLVIPNGHRPSGFRWGLTRRLRKLRKRLNKR
jgi:hypothetical protein